MTRHRRPVRRKHRHANASPAEQLTLEQQRALIPAGPSGRRHAQVDVEPRAKSEAGATLVTGEVVSTPVRRLYQQGNITLAQYWAAGRYEKDRDLGYNSIPNPLSALHVDAAVRSADSGIIRRLDHARAFRKANSYLGEEMAAVADALILQDHGARLEASYSAVGAKYLPCCSPNEQRAAGKGILSFTLERLANAYVEENHTH